MNWGCGFEEKAGCRGGEAGASPQVLKIEESAIGRRERLPPIIGREPCLQYRCRSSAKAPEFFHKPHQGLAGLSRVFPALPTTISPCVSRMNPSQGCQKPNAWALPMWGRHSCAADHRLPVQVGRLPSPFQSPVPSFHVPPLHSSAPGLHRGIFFATSRRPHKASIGLNSLVRAR